MIDIDLEEDHENGIPDFICKCGSIVSCEYVEDDKCLCCFCDAMKIESYVLIKDNL